MMRTPLQDLQTFRGLLGRFDTGILITHAGSNSLHGRPMALALVDDQCGVWFITDMDSPKSNEIRMNDQVMVAFQNKREEFVTLSGRAELVRDPRKLDTLWHDRFTAWFPEGKADPNLALIHVNTAQGEYWDNAGARQVSFLLEP